MILFLLEIVKDFVGARRKRPAARLTIRLILVYFLLYVLFVPIRQSPLCAFRTGRIERDPSRILPYLYETG